MTVQVAYGIPVQQPGFVPGPMEIPGDGASSGIQRPVKRPVTIQAPTEQYQQQQDGLVCSASLCSNSLQKTQENLS